MRLLPVALLLVARLAHADPVPTPAQAAQVTSPTPSVDVAAIQAADKALHDLQGRLGLPPGPPPSGFWDTTPGKVLQWTLYGLSVASASALSGIGVWQAATHK